MPAWKIFFTILYSAFIGSFIATTIYFIFVGPFALFAGIIGAFVGFAIALPLIPIAFLICIFLDRKGYIGKKFFMASAVVVCFVYGLLQIYLFQIPNSTSLILFPLGGFFSSWVYWRNIYEKKNGFKLF